MPTLDQVVPAVVAGANRQLRDISFWRSLNPDLHVCDPAMWSDVQVLRASDEDTAAMEILLVREGYFHLPPQSWGVSIAAMAEGIRRLLTHNIAPPFAFVYDEYWLLYVKMHAVLQRLLGADYRMLPDFWAWHVDPKKGEAGWTPHRDKGRWSLLPDGRPKSLTIWIPLTEATTLNGCMYIVPADRDPVYNTEREKEWAANMNYAGIRALPAQAGSLFCWNQAVLHWGSQTNPRAEGPRISMAFEFQRADIEPFNTPLMDPMKVSNLESRLRLIGKQVLQYQHMYPLAPDLEALARALL